MEHRMVNGLITIMLLVILSGCCYPALQHPISLDGNYKGRVVDELTREPIEGVVVTAIWNYVCPSVAGPKDHFYDAYETVTDDQGDFFIPGKGIRLFINLDPVTVAIFKAGYAYFESGWYSLQTAKLLSEKIAWEGKRAIIPLRKLTEEERLKGWMPSRPTIPPYRMKLLTEEINKVRIERGLAPFIIGEQKK